MRGAVPLFSLMTSSPVAEEYLSEHVKESTVFVCDVGIGVCNVIRFAAVTFCTQWGCAAVWFS